MSETPPAILVERLASARREGISFTDAWPGALDQAVGATASAERADWQEVLVGLVSTWRAAFERDPASAQQAALSMLVDESREPLPVNPCDWCDGEIPPERVNGGARYCTDECSRASRRERERGTSKRAKVAV